MQVRKISKDRKKRRKRIMLESDSESRPLAGAQYEVPYMGCWVDLVGLVLPWGLLGGGSHWAGSGRVTL